MPVTDLPLHRLVSKKAVETLFNAFGSLFGSSRLALLDAKGRFVAGARPWDDTLFPLHLLDELIGYVAVREPSPALVALQNSLELLIHEGFEKRKLAHETLERYREVNLIYHIAEIIGASLDVEEIAQKILSEAHRTIRADAGVIILMDPTTFDSRRVMLAGSESAGQEAAALLLRLVEQGQPVDAARIFAHGAQPGSHLETMLYAPMTAVSRSYGQLALVRGAGQPEFNAGDQNLLFALAKQAGIAIEKGYLHQRELERQEVENELKIGERIQRSLLPSSMPVQSGWDFAASYQSARQVGGDFYDFFDLPGNAEQGEGGCLGIAIADVTGKGIPAALMMAFSRAVLQTSATVNTNPGDVLNRTNSLFIQNSSSGLLVTVFYAILDPASGHLRYSNGGHEPPLWYHSATGVCEELDCVRSVVVGMLPRWIFIEQTAWLAPGDVLVLYTDGITEARNSAGKFFDEERLIDVISAHARGASSSQLLEIIQEEARSFTGGAPQSDDITIVVIRRSEDIVSGL